MVSSWIYFFWAPYILGGVFNVRLSGAVDFHTWPIGNILRRYLKWFETKDFNRRGWSLTNCICHGQSIDHFPDFGMGINPLCQFGIFICPSLVWDFLTMVASGPYPIHPKKSHQSSRNWDYSKLSSKLQSHLVYNYCKPMGAHGSYVQLSFHPPVQKR